MIILPRGSRSSASRSRPVEQTPARRRNPASQTTPSTPVGPRSGGRGQLRATVGRGFQPAGAISIHCSVYTGSTLGSMASIASNDDAGGLDMTSAVAFDAVGGTTYQIAVDGFGGASGTIVLSLSETLAAAPANDNFGNASTLSGRTVNTTGSNVSATNESGEPHHAGNS